MASYFGIDKLPNVFRTIKANGGIRATLYKLYRMDDIKTGTYIGMDNFGNKYYENKNNFYGRDRWVDFSPSVGQDYESSQVSTEWFGWLHHKTDIPPTKAEKLGYSWLANPNQPTETGTPNAYMPYSTTKPKIQAWTPSKK